MKHIVLPKQYKPDFTGRALAIDTETTGLEYREADRAYIVSMCNQDAYSWLWEWPVNPRTRQPVIPRKDIGQIKDVIADHDIPVFHNAKFDIGHLNAIGVTIPQKQFLRTHDTTIMSHVVDSKSSHELKVLAKRFLDMDDDDEQEMLDGVKVIHRLAKKSGIECRGLKEDAWMLRYFETNDARTSTYAAMDAERTIRLYLFFQKILRKDKLLHLYERERQLMYSIMDMQDTGITLYLPAVKPELQRMTKLAIDSEAALIRTAKQFRMEDFNLRSSKQLPELLFEHLRIPVIAETPNGAPTTAKGAIKDLLTNGTLLTTKQRQTLNHLQTVRQASKGCEYIKDYYARAIKSGRSRYATLHPSFNQNGTSTTRISSQRPNGQNISGRDEMPLRSLFSPPPGYIWLDFDYSNIELRLFAELAEETDLINAFKSGASMHQIVCRSLHGPGPLNGDYDGDDPRYKSCKNGTFSIIYGAGKARADATYGVPDAYDRIKQSFPGLKRITDRCYRDIARQGYVETLFGYRLYCDSGHAGLNYLIQGTAGDVMKYGMINIRNNISPKYAQPILTVHDELILQVPKDRYTIDLARDIAECMEHPGSIINIPTPVSAAIIADNWKTKQKLSLTQ